MSLETEYVDACIKGDFARRARLEAELDKQTDDANDRLNRPDALARAAMWYAKNGIAVFPCKPRDKTPATAHGFKDATTDAAQIAAWWSANPAYNVAAPTGITFDAIDVDGPEGVGALWGLGADVTLPEPIGHSLTSRPGGHHVFIQPTGAGNKAGIYKHVDYRGKGGYVVLPPSIGANGQRYRWLHPIRLDKAA